MGRKGNEKMKMLNANQVSEKLGITRYQVHNAYKNSDFPEPIRFGKRSYVWPEEAIDKWVEEKSLKAQQSLNLESKKEKVDHKKQFKRARNEARKNLNNCKSFINITLNENGDNIEFNALSGLNSNNNEDVLNHIHVSIEGLNNMLEAYNEKMSNIKKEMGLM